jgi:hypothetical protein
MKKSLSVSIGALLLAASLSANAWWGGDRWGGYGYNDWPVWTPMYWMEEMSDSWDDDYYDGYYGGGPWGGGPWGGGPWGGPYGGPGYYGAPYGGGYYGAPYGGGYYGAPYGGGYAPAYPAAPVPAPAE